MPLKNDRYTYRVTWSEDDQEYVGLCSEFPSLSWLDQEPESALKGIREVVDNIIKDMKHSGEEVPRPMGHARNTVVSLWFVSRQKFIETLPFKHLNRESA